MILVLSFPICKCINLIRSRLTMYLNSILRTFLTTDNSSHEPLASCFPIEFSLAESQQLLVSCNYQGFCLFNTIFALIFRVMINRNTPQSPFFALLSVLFCSVSPFFYRNDVYPPRKNTCALLNKELDHTSNDTYFCTRSILLCSYISNYYTSFSSILFYVNFLHFNFFLHILMTFI